MFFQKQSTLHTLHALSIAIFFLSNKERLFQRNNKVLLSLRKDFALKWRCANKSILKRGNKSSNVVDPCKMEIMGPAVSYPSFTCFWQLGAPRMPRTQKFQLFFIERLQLWRNDLNRVYTTWQHNFGVRVLLEEKPAITKKRISLQMQHAPLNS